MIECEILGERCQLFVNFKLDPYVTKLIDGYCQYDIRTAKVCQAVLRWAQKNKILGPDYLSEVGYIFMVIAHLQKSADMPCLPNLQWNSGKEAPTEVKYLLK